MRISFDKLAVVVDNSKEISQLGCRARHLSGIDGMHHTLIHLDIFTSSNMAKKFDPTFDQMNTFRTSHITIIFEVL